MRQPSLEAEFQSTIRRHQLRRPRKSKAQGRMSTNRLSRIVAIGNTARLRSVREPARHDEMLVVNSNSEDARQTAGVFLSELESCVNTASGPGSPSGQPAWGGGCDRIAQSVLREKVSSPIKLAWVRSRPDCLASAPTQHKQSGRLRTQRRSLPLAGPTPSC